VAKTTTHHKPPSDEPKSVSRPSSPKRRFRWSLVLVPGVCILAVWILNHVQPAITWEQILDRFQVQGQERQRMSRLVALGLICIGAVWVKRIWGGDE
jgi:ferric-dicitrate binding protein FerR (iron transport regulator)